MELKFKEVGKEYNVNRTEIKELKIRPYLKIEEIDDIAKQCLETDDQVAREMIKYCKVVEYCTNIDIGNSKKINGQDVYDMIVENGLYYSIWEEIVNFDVINDTIRESEGVYQIGKMFVELISKSIDKIDLNKIQEQFNSSIDKLKVVEENGNNTSN